jgi:hypothetical protein
MSLRFLFLVSLISVPFIARRQTLDSLSTAIREQIAYQQIYSAWEGVPNAHFDNMEIHGYSTLDRDIYFNDSLFEEFVIVDEWGGIIFDIAYGGAIDSCAHSDNNHIIVYSGTWHLNADTIVLAITAKSIYDESTDFYNGYFEYHHAYPRLPFNCSSALKHRCERAEERKLIFVDDRLKEIGGREICYR